MIENYKKNVNIIYIKYAYIYDIMDFSRTIEKFLEKVKRDTPALILLYVQFI